jgi:predicted deacylase
MPDTAQVDFELLPLDITPYRRGNSRIDYVHRFDSGKFGPDVLINGLTHGNELCGAYAIAHLLEANVRPRIGRLTLSLANVEAYQSFDSERPFASRELVHNMNRIWSPHWLDGEGDSPELRRARELCSIVGEADHILDIHSTAQPMPPFWVVPNKLVNRRAADSIGVPHLQLIMPNGLKTGTPLVEYGRHGDLDGRSVAIVVECGQHFLKNAATTAVDTSYRFLSYLGLIDQPQTPPSADPSRYELLGSPVIKTESFRFVRALVGLESFGAGELIAIDGEEEIRSPCDGCTVFMPSRQPRVGREALYLTRPYLS